MSSLVSDFIINPVLRQARRFSEISRTTLTGEDHEPTPPSDIDAVSDSGIAGGVVHEALEQLETPAEEPIARRPETPRSPAVSTSTQETRVADAPETPPSVGNTTHDHLGFPLSPRRGRAIPEDDGMHELRRRIQAINAEDAPSAEKARRMHELLLEDYRASQVTNRRKPTPHMEEEALSHEWEPSTSPGPLESLKSWYNHSTDQPSTADKFILCDSDIAPTFAPIRPRKGSDVELQGQGSTTPTESQAPLGCQHYERNVKLQCFTCKKWYTCRFCHDAAEDHGLVRRETRNMLCMLCGTPQKASDMCINCGEVSAHYYCNICKLWENRKSKPIYHCNDCGICRRGLGLGKDFFHCKSYNTVELQIHGQGSQELQTAAERAEAAASAQQPSPDIQRPAMTPPATSSRAGTWIPNRRRHSSHGIELQHHAPDRFARSLSPLESGIDYHLTQIAADVDSEDDILGFWRGNRSQEDQPEDEDDDLSEEESDSDLDSDGVISTDEDEDDDDDILLIGHR
ncbi:CHY and RING finger domain protein, putative [Metarhizium acridum CQMa 102]|uniref:CHY and RING finger domain protein, putative n=1 Tax=Metarhizium acridum (strain CQMa 102) TaxID=655827 RepID=E9EHT5_METAQ|nr:CHY and RING finger domain protein, putative [Metarhizium acridum CQMa 102]EFY84522.1 CHY and RING finger domain protein, putative [Metarhizium acridum CQMa 102]